MGRKSPFKLDVVSVRLVKDAALLSKVKLDSPKAAVAFLGSKLSEMDREMVCVINVNTKNIPINCHIVSIGTLSAALVEPRELFKASILSNAASILVLHNHPSGVVEPSKEDTIMTDRLMRISKLIGISFLDHIIVGWDNPDYFSFREKGIFPSHQSELNQDDRTLPFGPVVAERGKGR